MRNVSRNLTLELFFAAATCTLFAACLALTGCSGFAPEPARAPVAPLDPLPNFSGDRSLDNEDRVALANLIVDEMQTSFSPDAMGVSMVKIRRALSLDPSNTRAQFWNTWMVAASEAQGIVARVKPLFLRQPEGARRYARFEIGATQGLTESWKRFVLDGPSDIETTREAQDWLDRWALRIEELRSWLKANRDSSLKLRVPVLAVSRSSVTTSPVAACEPFRIGPVTFPSASCMGAVPNEFSLNRADLEVLSLHLAIFETQLRLLNAYRLDPKFAFDVLSPQTRQPRRKFIENLREALRSGPTPYRSTDHFARVDELVRDSILAVRYLSESRERLCPDDGTSPPERASHLFAFPLCFDEPGRDEASRTIESLESLLAGNLAVLSMDEPERLRPRFWLGPGTLPPFAPPLQPVPPLTPTSPSVEASPTPAPTEPTPAPTPRPQVTIEFSPLRFFERPISNLQAFLPMSLDRCAQLKTFDSTPFRPYVTKGNLESWVRAWLENRNQPCETPPPTVSGSSTSQEPR